MYECISAGLKVESQVPVPVVYKEVKLDCGFRIDLLVNSELIVELKSSESILPIHEAQLLTYLKLRRLKTGLLINFNVLLLKEGLKRLVL